MPAPSTARASSEPQRLSTVLMPSAWAARNPEAEGWLERQSPSSTFPRFDRPGTSWCGADSFPPGRSGRMPPKPFAQPARAMKPRASDATEEQRTTRTAERFIDSAILAIGHARAGHSRALPRRSAEERLDLAEEVGTTARPPVRGVAEVLDLEQSAED